MPFCHLQIKVLRSPYPDKWKCTQKAAIEPKTIGEHLKRRRLELHLLQTEVGRRLGVHKGSIQTWERGIGLPGIRQLPAVIEFIGCDPEPEPEDLPRRIAYARRRLGFTQENLAKVLKVNPVTVWSWESGRTRPSETRLQQMQLLLNGGSDLLPLFVVNPFAGVLT